MCRDIVTMVRDWLYYMTGILNEKSLGCYHVLVGSSRMCYASVAHSFLMTIGHGAAPTMSAKAEVTEWRLKFFRKEVPGAVELVCRTS